MLGVKPLHLCVAVVAVLLLGWDGGVDAEQPGGIAALLVKQENTLLDEVFLGLNPETGAIDADVSHLEWTRVPLEVTANAIKEVLAREPEKFCSGVPDCKLTFTPPFAGMIARTTMIIRGREAARFDDIELLDFLQFHVHMLARPGFHLPYLYNEGAKVYLQFIMPGASMLRANVASLDPKDPNVLFDANQLFGPRKNAFGVLVGTIEAPPDAKVASGELFKTVGPLLSSSQELPHGRRVDEMYQNASRRQKYLSRSFEPPGAMRPLLTISRAGRGGHAAAAPRAPERPRVPGGGEEENPEEKKPKKGWFGWLNKKKGDKGGME